jgi:ribosomal protein S18 acetylase RimI-like enzyme
MNLEIRVMTTNDLSAVVQIEEDSFRNAWTVTDFRREMQLRNAFIKVVADSEGITVLGFNCVRYHATGFTIENMAVAVQYRRKGICTLLMDDLKQMLGREFNKQRNCVVHQVSELNLEMQLFLRACGFRARNVIRDGYEPGIDSYEMAFIKLAGVTDEERSDAALGDSAGIGPGGQSSAGTTGRTKEDVA